MQQLLIIDGYNLIFSEDSLFRKKSNKNRKKNLSDARESLLEMLSSYASYKGMPLVVVFDAYNVENGEENTYRYDRNTQVIYTSKDETADTVIERTVHEYKKHYAIKVVTSDKSQQDYILSQGAIRMSSREMWIDIVVTNKRLYKEHVSQKRVNEPLMKNMNNRTFKVLESIRRGSKKHE